MAAFVFFERRAHMLFQFIQECSLESFTKTGVVKELNDPPEAVIGEAAFSKKTMDMRIPFQRSAEGMQDTDETGDKVSAFVQFKEHSENDTADGLKKAVKPGAVNAVLITAGRAKLRMTAERNKFKFAAVGTAIHGTDVRRVSTVNHLLNVFHDNGTWMKSIFNFFIVFFKNLLKDVHKSIMKEPKTENNPTPQD